MTSKILLLIAAFFLAIASASAQSYSRISLTNFVSDAGKYVATTNISVPANTLVSVISEYRSANLPYLVLNGSNVYEKNRGISISVQYPGGPFVAPALFEGGYWDERPVLGPCTLRLTTVATNNNKPAAYAILKYRTGNFSRISLTNFVSDAGKYVATTNIVVPANTLVTVVSEYRSANIPYLVLNGSVYEKNRGIGMSVQYPAGSFVAPALFEGGYWDDEPVLGPCTLRLTTLATNNNNPAAYAILEYTPIK